MTDAPAEFESVEEDTPEDLVRACFDQARGGGWRVVTWEQYGPDGSTVIARLAFFCCPICGVMVANPRAQDPEVPPEDDYPQLHIDWHVREIR